jgi:hypothetical protein
VPKIENPEVSKSCSMRIFFTPLSMRRSISRRAAVVLMPLVDMTEMSYLAARFAAAKSGPKPSFSMNKTVSKRFSGPVVGKPVS